MWNLGKTQGSHWCVWKFFRFKIDCCHLKRRWHKNRWVRKSCQICYRSTTFRFPVKFMGAVGQMTERIFTLQDKSQHLIYFWQGVAQRVPRSGVDKYKKTKILWQFSGGLMILIIIYTFRSHCEVTTDCWCWIYRLPSSGTTMRELRSTLSRSCRNLAPRALRSHIRQILMKTASSTGSAQMLGKFLRYGRWGGGQTFYVEGHTLFFNVLCGPDIKLTGFSTIIQPCRQMIHI